MEDAQFARSVLPGTALLFLHIPKTAGTTLHRIIEREYNPLRIYTIEGGAIDWSIDHFKKLPERRRGTLSVVKGHMSFGLHEFLPQRSTYITFLRDPVDRCLSSYYYSMGNPLNPFHDRIKREKIDVLTFLDAGYWHQNLQCKMLAGIDRREYRPVELMRQMRRLGARPPGPELDRWSNAETLEKAKENLVRFFSFVGVSDRFSDGLVLLKHIFGWKLPSYSNYRKSRARPKTATLDPGVLAEVERRNQFDRALYEFGKEMFTQIAERTDLDLEREAATFRNSARRKRATVVDFGSTLIRAAASRLASLP
jgi:Sulfotransferase family